MYMVDTTSLRKQSYGAYKSAEECEKVLLRIVMDMETVYPEFITEDMKQGYVESIYKLQHDRILPDRIHDLPSLTTINEMYKTQLMEKE